MALYILIRHSDEQVEERIERECSNDAEALKLAFSLALTCGVDVWRGERIVGTVAARNGAEAERKPKTS